MKKIDDVHKSENAANATVFVGDYGYLVETGPDVRDDIVELVRLGLETRKQMENPPADGATPYRADGGADIVMAHKDIRDGALPKLAVTENGKALDDQAEGVRRFKEACLDAAWRGKIEREKWRSDLPIAGQTKEQAEYATAKAGLDLAEPGSERTAYAFVRYVDRPATWRDWALFSCMLLGAFILGAAVLAAV